MAPAAVVEGLSMSNLPAIPCPACHSQIPLEVWLAHAGARQALVTLAELHPGWRLGAVALRYLALFAPAKRTLSLDRVADLLGQLAELIGPARVQWQGRAWAAPVDVWIAAMEHMLADAMLRRPLKNHNYLRAVVANLADREEGCREQAADARAAGRTPVGAISSEPQFRHVGHMPASVRDVLKQANPKKEPKHG